MNFRLLILMLSLLIILTGCMGAKVKYAMPTFEKLDSFNIGKLQEKAVGETMVYKIDARVIPGYMVIADYQVPSPGFGVQYPLIRTGYECAVIGYLENGDIICSLSDRPTVSGDPVNWQYCLALNKNGEPYGDTSCVMINVREWSDNPNNFLKPTKIFSKGSFKQELIYNGKSKDMVKLQYREYKDDFARPAFYQDLIYDLSESKDIGFRGMKIEIIEATNSYIRFIVKTSMN